MTAPADFVLDHVIVGGGPIDTLVEWWTKATGQVPQPGGAHEELGTHNAICPLGDAYVELIAIDPSNDRTNQITEQLASATSPRTFGWCLRSRSGRSVAMIAEGLPVPTRTMSMSREADGRRLIWDAVFPATDLGSAIPFFIDWGTAVRPGTSSRELSIEVAVQHPNPSRVEAVLRSMGISVPIQRETDGGVALTVRSPRGVLEVRP